MNMEEWRNGDEWGKTGKDCERTLSGKIFTQSCSELKARNRGENPASKNLSHKIASNVS